MVKGSNAKSQIAFKNLIKILLIKKLKRFQEIAIGMFYNFFQKLNTNSYEFF